ncbi:MAG TPA: glycosyltransferase family 4 protein [Gemmataceae bacterium]|nr:glycosyltransferase family 4 protein [Gemmataceae bacterium]
MKIAFCYDQVFPARGGCGTYITDLSRRLVADHHEVHLYACRWDEQALPEAVQCHALPMPRGPRFWRPWRFARLCEAALAKGNHDVSVGFDKTYGQDVLYPQGGLHVASVEHNLNKYSNSLMRGLVRAIKSLDLAHLSYMRLEKKQYLGLRPPLIVVNSHMVRQHFEHYYGVPPENLHVIRSSIDPGRFPEQDRLKRRIEWRDQWGIGPEETVALFVAINYRLKGIEPLLYAVRALVQRPEYPHLKNPFRLVIAGNPDYRRWEAMARKLGIAERVRFVGLCTEMKNAYFASDFLVHPTFYDPCSLVVLEGLACSLPIITSRANGASELLHPLQEGYVVDDPHDYQRLAWCLWQLMDPERRSACSQAARKTAQQWTFEQHYRQLLRVFTEAAARKRAA